MVPLTWQSNSNSCVDTVSCIKVIYCGLSRSANQPIKQNSHFTSLVEAPLSSAAGAAVPDSNGIDSIFLLPYYRDTLKPKH